MDFQIDKSLKLVINGRQTSVEPGSPVDDPLETLVNEAFAESGELEKFEDRISIPSEPSEGQSQTISNIQEAVGTAESALAAIVELREKQAELLETTKSTPFGSQSEEIYQEFEAIQGEIENIAREAQYNGSSVINNSSSYTYDDSTNNIHSVVTLPNSQSQLGEITYKPFTQEYSEINQEFIEESLFGVRSLSDAASAASDKAKQLERAEVERNPLEKAAIEEKLSQSPSDYSEARELAGKIASKLSSPYNREAQSLSIISSVSDGLDEDRVKKLLAEA